MAYSQFFRSMTIMEPWIEKDVCCPACSRTGQKDGEICEICCGQGILPVENPSAFLFKYVFNIITKVDDILDKVNDIKEKCDEIFDKVK
jgi:hypothetical protein